MPSLIQSSLLLLRDYIMKDYDRYNEIHAGEVMMDDWRTILEIQEVAAKLDDGELSKMEGWEEAVQGVRDAARGVEEAREATREAPHDVAKAKAFKEIAKSAVDVAAALQRSLFGEKAMKLIVQDTESYWPLGSKLVGDGLRLLTWEIIRGHTNAWSAEDKEGVVGALEKVLEDLDIDASGWAIEGMSEIDYHEPLDAVRCNARSKALPEDARKMVELLKITTRKSRETLGKGEYLHCPINIDVESEVPFGKATDPALDKKAYYTILLEFSGLRREVYDTLNRGEGPPGVTISVAQSQDGEKAAPAGFTPRPATDVEFLASLSDIKGLSGIKTTKDSVQRATPRAACPFRPR